MEEQIKDLIYSIASGDAVETENKLNAIMSQKAMAALDDMRVNVSNSMFTQKAQAEE
jgi:hypothetical protein